MKVKVFEKNDKGKIEFTRKELEALLNEVFNDGYQEGKDSKTTYTWTSPTWTTLNGTGNAPKWGDTYYTTTCCTDTGKDSSECDTVVYMNGVVHQAESIYYGNIEGQMELDLT